MYRPLKNYFLALYFLVLAHKGQAQVELSGLAGPAFNYASVSHHPDSTGKALRSESSSGYAVTLEARLPMQHGFQLKAGIRFLYKNFAFEQVYDLSGYNFKNEWFIDGYALETPVHIAYPIIDRRFQITIGAGMAAVKNWVNYENAGISGISSSGSSGSATTTSSFYGTFITHHFEPGKNYLSLAGELSTEISLSDLPRFSLGILWHQDLLKQFGKLTYQNNYGVQAASNQPALFRSKGSFEIERPGYFLVQLKYTFAGRSKEGDLHTGFEDDNSE